MGRRCQLCVWMLRSWLWICVGSRLKIFAREVQACCARSLGLRLASFAERGPPTHPVMVLLGSGCGVHQTGGISVKLKRKLRSAMAGWVGEVLPERFAEEQREAAGLAHAQACGGFQDVSRVRRDRYAAALQDAEWAG